MSDQDSNLIAQIREKEKEMAEMLESTKAENDQQISDINDNAKQLISKTEEDAKTIGYKRLQEAKEKGKTEYKRILAEEDRIRRDEAERGKTNLSKAKKYIKEELMKMFN